MPLISNTNQKKLKDLGINIKTKYIVGNDILERNTDNRKNDVINKGVRCEKDYYYQNNLIYIEKNFDTRMEYTYIESNDSNKEYKCSNCGMVGKLREFVNGCPYCHTVYNIDYADKELGNKYHYDRVLRNPLYRVVTAIIDLALSILFMYFLLKNISRTFNFYDISKVFIYGIILALVLYYFFYILDAYIILEPIKRYKDRQNKKQMLFWQENGIDKKSFFNNLNYEVSNKYYDMKNVIDYDILDYDSFLDYHLNDDYFVKVKAYVRIVYFINNKFKAKYIEDTYIMKKNTNDIVKLENGFNKIKCHKCGASIDVTKGVCEYCHSSSKYFQEWFLDL